MQILITPTQLDLPAGTVIRVPATWQEYQTLADQRGDGSIPRMKYCNGELFLMVPLPEHGKDASLIARIIEVLLDAQGLEYDSFTPITMTLPESGGIEPDYCFYIQSLDQVRGKKRIDWQVDPPPDLVLEIDVTNYSNVNDYLPYQVPEIWMFKGNRLNVYILNGNAYCLTQASRYFPSLQLQTIVDQYRQIAYEQSSSQAIRQLRQRFPS
ncbi:MAG: Uma2 family endonuclease [Elainella sp. C42_A2020_010]|nr:Uma2 family endonuclease [Elainella sp. C42_A2020_010]